MLLDFCWPGQTTDWVNLSKRVGKDGVFQGLAGLLRWISRGRSPREILFHLGREEIVFLVNLLGQVECDCDSG